jgi:RNA polymerase sigma-54 factor
MPLEAKLLQKMNQSLLMTPQLQQAIKLLQLGRLDYQDAIQKELLENPLLEEASQTEESPTAGENLEGTNIAEIPLLFDVSTPAAEGPDEQPASRLDWEDFTDAFTDFSGVAQPKGSQSGEDYRPAHETAIVTSQTLQDFLLDQVRFLDISANERNLLLHVIGNLNADGFLAATTEELADEAGCSVTDINESLEILRTFDPPGVGASSVRECLLIQLDRIGKVGLESKIVANHLDKLEKHRLDLIAKAENLPIEVIKRAILEIKKLEPHPGRQFISEAQRYIIPDVYVTKVGNDYIVELNEEGVPRLRMSQHCLSMLKSFSQERHSEDKSYLQERHKSALWLLKSIQQRQRTILRVSESIVRFQRDFLDYGISRLRPLVLKTVADDVGIHESTVSRVTSNKYMHTPQGVLELKFFFTTAIKSEAGDLSSSSIKERIKALIASETPSAPLSDQQLVELLKQEKIPIARRTVAKYREMLGIESSAIRRNKDF